MARILIVDDEDKIRHILSIMLKLKGHQVEEAESGRKALELLERSSFDVIITDLRMPEMDGFELLERVKQSDTPLPVIVITAYATIESAVEAMKKGAVDYITKPFEESQILLAVEKAIGVSRIIQENIDLKRKLKRLSKSGEIVCVSKAMQQVMDLALKVAAKPDTTVLITGESGTGKEVVARFIHDNSPRKKGRFVAVNCAAITDTLVESTLFGHEKGAFTGADRSKQGVFEYASGGTLFLDEIGDLPLEAQAKLLRALQEKTIQRVGGNEPIPVDVRVICATNQDLEKLVEEGEFRQDLYFRINVFPIHIPPLRERKEAIVPLAEFFIKKFMDSDSSDQLLTEGAKRILKEYSWPGNIRELANTMERAAILAGLPPITAEHLSFLTRQKEEPPQKGFKLPEEGINLEELEKDFIKQALEITGGNQSAAAKLLGLTRSKFRTRLKQLEESN
ncbi:MAG: sigma-54-dependent Fis family transcriptional regulator [Thermodesulfobacteria bacterium]|nr:sigma-54-dependent Fis family transcriptional regulator [Thermodesulfobacteriota bacterium]